MPYPNTANTSILSHHGRNFALYEFGEPYEIKLPDAETVGSVGIGIDSGMTFNALPKIDPITNELVYLRHRLGMAPYLSCGILDKEGSLTYETDIDVPYPVMMHDFAITSHYIVIINQVIQAQLQINQLNNERK